MISFQLASTVELDGSVDHEPAQLHRFELGVERAEEGLVDRHAGPAGDPHQPVSLDAGQLDEPVGLSLGVEVGAEGSVGLAGDEHGGARQRTRDERSAPRSARR